MPALWGDLGQFVMTGKILHFQNHQSGGNVSRTSSGNCLPKRSLKWRIKGSRHLCGMDWRSLHFSMAFLPSRHSSPTSLIVSQVSCLCSVFMTTEYFYDLSQSQELFVELLKPLKWLLLVMESSPRTVENEELANSRANKSSDGELSCVPRL